MSRRARRAAVLAIVAAAVSAPARGAESAGDERPKISASITGSYYAMRDEPDFGVGVASINRGPLRFEARYNYEARHATSTFVGWKLAGGESLTYEVTPIAGVLFGAAHGVIPGLEASVAYRSIDAYIEAEYVFDRDSSDDNYFYAWSELGWRPVEWLRIGLVGQRTRIVHTDRDLQRGIFAQVTVAKLTVGLYAFNPDAGSRYTILSVGASF
jgi:hypothetical protein